MSKTLESIERPRYRYWQALFLAWYKPSFYVDVAKRWKGLGLIYLLIVVLLTCLPFSLRMNHDFREYFQEQVASFQELPSIPIKQGKLQFDKPMPYFIKNKAGQIMAIIDTTGKIKTKTAKYPYLALLLTESQISYWPPSMKLYFIQTGNEEAKPMVYSFPPQMNEVFDGKTWIKTSGIQKTKSFMWFILYPLIVCLFYFIFVPFLLTFTFMGQIMASAFFKYNLKYTVACRLLMVSATAPIVLFFLSLVMNKAFVGMGVLLLILLAVYFCYAVLSVQRDSKKMLLF